MLPDYLYRGVSAEMHTIQGGELRPKQFGSFSREPEFGRDEWSNCFWGNSSLNSVVEHQRHQAGYPTSGISTTPHLDRARFYATNGDTLPGGYIYVIDKELCKSLGVILYEVNSLVPQPSVTEDDEVILVAQDYGVIPSGVIVNVLAVGT